MIKMENGKLAIVGTRAELVQEFMCIVNSFLSKGIMSEEMMANLIGLICIPEEELKKIMIDYIDSMDDIGTALDLLSRL